ncbi:MAG: SRPBCC domain-containing protein [Bacteroidetes bacterium]|nr:SRPBCC domain-containing protein [Bacteroidota bacterium]MBS1630763.1 SRPBCC domain-containing protein [Bacteroidota bacterium]
MENKTKIEAPEGMQELRITRVFDLPLELLFKAHAEPKLLEQWMGTTVLKLENKQHGSFVFETKHQNQVVFRAHGTIHAFIPQQKIVRTFEMEQTQIGPQLEFLEFEALSEETSRLNMQVIYRSEQHRSLQLQLPFEYGLNRAHEQLQNIMQSL